MEPVILAEVEFWRSIQRTPAASQVGGVMLQEQVLVKGPLIPLGENYKAVVASYLATGLYCILVDTPAGYVLWHQPGTPKVMAPPPPSPPPRAESPISAAPPALLALTQALQAGIEAKDRRYQFQTYPQAFVGSEALEWLMRTQGLNRKQALALGQDLLKAGHIQRLDAPGGDFQEGNTFYRFATPATPAAIPVSPPDSLGNTPLDLEVIFQAMVAQLPLQDRWYQFRRYPQCFTGAEAVEWLMRTQGLSRKQATQVGEELCKLGLIRHSTGEHPFRDGNYFYGFGDQT
ncbi:Putative DEP domain-containing mTOR-interacting protein [Gloeomargarita lithophora Alchichica-D10]|uniref:DEP domain-containing mTOR-interacting protein n=1 Tax=Gloeomargarita lithophora Alchichica-D10 TaxID=1188229 RepID=A0A1J0A9X7_9CYAN|nr:DEP domain-containing protein [Gloeomargarita lithophora]APB32717.1 Putative DEP domain-containing mTOR-interacting protein [Gloeomargarita lithophora Alchichica-D10]